MAGKHINEGFINMLSVYLAGGTGYSTLYLGLYTDTSEPAATVNMTSGGITEQTGSGYSRIALTTATLSTSGVTATYTTSTFTATAPWNTDTYGYFVTTTSTGTGGRYLWVEHFSNGPYPMSTSNTIDIEVNITK